MTLLLPLIALISEQPGSFVYHLVMMAWLMVAAVGALNQSSRTPAAARAALAALSLFTLQLIYFLVVCLASAALINANLILPPLDRALSAATLLLFIWCANFPDPSRPGDVFTVLLLLMVGLALGGSLWFWNGQLTADPQMFFNGLPESPWEIGKMGLLGLGLLVLILRRRSAWPLALAGLSLVLLGHLLHYFLAPYFALENSHFPGIERLADLLAAPLLVALLLRRSQAAPEKHASPESLEDTAPRGLTLDAPTTIALASLPTAEGAALAQAITQTVAHAFHADMCLWLDAPDRPGGPQLAGAYDLAREQFLPARLILLSEMPYVTAALKVSGLTQLTPETHPADLRQMARAVGREPTTPALLAPLRHAEGPALGALILLTAQRVWTNEEQNLLTALAEALAALVHARQQAAQQRADFDRLTAELAQAHQTDSTLQTRLTQVTADLAAVQSESQRLLAEAGQTKAEANRQRLALEDLTFQLQTRQQLEASHTALMGEVADLRDKLAAAQQDTGERQRAEDELAAALERIAALTLFEQQLEGAQRELAEYREQERQLREDLKQARAEWAAREAEMTAKAALVETAVPPPDEAAQAREQQLQLDNFQLQSELAEAQAVNLAHVAAQAEAASALAAVHSDLENTRAAALEQAEQLRTELNASHQEMERAQAQEAELRQALAHMYQESQQHAQTTEALAEARAEVEQLRADLAEAQTWNTALAATQAALDEAAAKLALAQDDAQNYRAELDTAHAELARAQSQLTELEQVRAELNHAVSQRMSYAVQLDDKTRALTTLQAELLERTEEVELLRAKLDDHRRATEPWAGDFERVQTRPLPKLTLPVAPPPLDDPLPPSGDREVVNSLSQELRQPMSSISGYTDLLLSESVGILGALQRKFLERIKASTERMGALLDDLIHVTALDSGALALTHESLDVTATLEEAVQSCEAQFRERSVELSLDLIPDLPRLNADHDALRQIFTHLLHNAAAVSPANSEVVLTMRREAEPGQHLGPPNEYLLIAVHDSGSGIAPEDQPRVFSRLYRADAPLVAGVGDTGVGLSMVKALVEAHGGRIWVTSQPEAGSTFYVLLPLNSPPPKNGHNGGQP